ncbi:MAG: acyl-CoA dehydrogenase [Dehalococcoidia bacterium]|nr:acyl-CoA dehydrogenase [Dehalococcoidia bacterium]
MDFQFTPQEEQFRTDLRAFLAQHLPADWSDRSFIEAADSDDRKALADQMTKLLAQKDWLALAWPKQYGGLDANHLMQLIFNEETAYHAMPGGGGPGVTAVGPAIMLFGNQEQKDTYLPRITRGDDSWSLLYTEPGSGSDLASIQTRAVRDGDTYVLNGQKVWIAGAQDANMGWVAARTDPTGPKHKGLSTIIVPMDSPGVTVRPLTTMAGERTLSEVYLDNVRVPAENLVGTENRGWYQVAASLDFERSGVGAYANGRRNIEKLVDIARDEREALGRNPRIRYELADRWLELDVGFNIAYRIPYLQSQGVAPNHEASVSKLYGSELTQRIANTGIELLGLAGQLAPGSPGAPLRGALVRAYLNAVSSTIASGTSEIQRNIIAQRGLGMPRG